MSLIASRNLTAYARRQRVLPRLIRFSSNSLKNEIKDRYQKKLEEKAKALGLNDTNELKEKLKDTIEKTKKELDSVDPLKELEEYEARMGKNSNQDGDAKTIKVRSPFPKEAEKKPYKTLESFIDTEKSKDLSRDELEFIWRMRFSSNERHLHAVLSDVQFSKMYANGFKNPAFILPLPRSSDGHEMHFVQWSFVGPKTTHCMLTTVAEYKLHKEYAKPHTTLMFHQDFADSKGVIFMNGYVDEESSLSMDDAQLLVLNVQRFYGELGDPARAEKRLQLLQRFTTGDADFNLDELISEAAAIE